MQNRWDELWSWRNENRQRFPLDKLNQRWTRRHQTHENDSKHSKTKQEWAPQLCRADRLQVAEAGGADQVAERLNHVTY